MSEQVDDFLVHYGIPGMKWGKRSSSSSKNISGDKPKMSKQKKIAIAVGVGAVVAVGAAVALSAMNKNMDLPIGSLVKHKSTDKGSKAFQAHEKRMASVMDGLRLEAESPLKTRKDLDKYRTESRDKLLKEAGLTLAPRSAPHNSPRPSMPSGAPSLNTLSSIINGGPKVTFNSKTGRYDTQ